MRDPIFCTVCGREHPPEELYEFDDQLLCDSCLEAETVLCSECGTRICRLDNAGTERTPLCQDCFDSHYTNCYHCGALLRESDAWYTDSDPYDEQPYCPACYQEQAQERPIHDYNYKPDPIFHGEGPRYFGVELELDNGGENPDKARKLLETANRAGEYLYIKHDGSLDYGLELVTHPLSLETHLQQMPWQAVLEQAVSLGYLSHRTGTCGLHIHVSRDAFGETETDQDTAIARILYFVEKHWEELLKFSRRTTRQLERWANRYGYKDQPRDILDHAKKGFHSGRYACVNLLNCDTIEFRIFRGTLKYNTLIATLQMVNRICDAALFLCDEELRDLSWTTFVSGVQEPELIQYLKERRLYVNEPVEMEAEV